MITLNIYLILNIFNSYQQQAHFLSLMAAETICNYVVLSRFLYDLVFEATPLLEPSFDLFLFLFFCYNVANQSKLIFPPVFYLTAALPSSSVPAG